MWGKRFTLRRYMVEAGGRVLYDGSDYQKAKVWFADQVGRRPPFEVTLKSDGVVARRFTPKRPTGITCVATQQ